MLDAALAWTLLRGWLLYETNLGRVFRQFKKETSVMLWTILVILLVLWLVGLLSHVGGSLIHLLLVVAVVVLIINLVTGRRAV
jgi:uncharacterized protein DUF5670